MPELVLGPLVRCAEATSVAVWVETDVHTHVTVRAGDVEASVPTFAVHGHHYALVVVDGLPVGEPTPYELSLDDTVVWPLTDSPYPAPVLPTIDPETPLRMAFGSCRTSVPHDEEGNSTHGIDALRAYGLRMAGVARSTDDPEEGEIRWPDLVLFLGDQVYADETSPQMREFIASRRSLEEPPGTELKDYEEYAHLYRLAWSDPATRWLLSTLPSAMIFDDHDVRDDWNTSLSWLRDMQATSWWHERIVSGLTSYWVYQHLGNLGREERDVDPVWQHVVRHDGPDELDLTDVLDGLSERVQGDPTAYRYSYSRTFGTQARLVVVDSRAARVLQPERRSIVDDSELAWLDERLRGDVDHLLIGTSLPFFLASGLHHLEAFNEALASGRWGRRAGRVGERLRRAVDMEHWAAFQEGFRRVSDMVIEVAAGQRGEAPGTVTFLSGDVHHSYVAEAFSTRAREREGAPALRSRLLQAVCSPIRNPLPRGVRVGTAFLSRRVAAPIGRAASLAIGVPPAPLRWGYVEGPWFDNNLATLEVEGRGLRMWWARGEVVDGHHDLPSLVEVADITVDPPATAPSQPRREVAAT